MLTNKKVSELTYLSSGSIDPLNSMIEIVQSGENFRTTPKDYVQSAIPINIDALPTGSASVITTASNLGSGLGVYGQKVNNDLQFKSLIAGNNITLSSSSVGITINAASSTGSAVVLKSFTLNEDMAQGDLSIIMSNGNIRKLQYSVFGDEYVYNEANTDSNNVITMDSNKVVIIYRDVTSTTLVAKVGFIDNSSITFGSASVFDTGSSSTFISGTSLDSTRFVLAYRPSGQTAGLLRVGIIEGTSITFSSGSIFASGASSINRIHCTALDSSRVVVVYRNPNLSSYCYANMGTITGTNITYGSSSIIVSANAHIAALSTLSTTSFVVGYRKTASNYEGDLKVGTVTGTDIVFGNATTYDTSSNTIAYIDNIATLNSLKFVINYADNGHSDRGTSKIGTILGTTITLGAAASFTSSTTSPGNVIPSLPTSIFTDTRFAVSFTNGGSGSIRVGTVIGSTVSYSNVSSFNGSTYYIAADNIDTASFVINYTDLDNSNYGTIIFAAGDPSLITDRISGILQASGSAGQLKPVAMFGETSTVHAGLIPGHLYYYNITSKNGVVGNNNDHLVGVALSTTEIKIVSY